MSQRVCILLLGSNLGDTKKNIEIAVEYLEKAGLVVLKKSEFLFTEPVEFVSSNNFCNFAVSIYTTVSPINLLKIIKKIEREMGRNMDSTFFNQYQDRIIDIDIVSFGSLVFKGKTLEIPHQKHLFERDFSKTLINQL